MSAGTQGLWCTSLEHTVCQHLGGGYHCDDMCGLQSALVPGDEVHTPFPFYTGCLAEVQRRSELPDEWSSKGLSPARLQEEGNHNTNISACSSFLRGHKL